LLGFAFSLLFLLSIVAIQPRLLTFGPIRFQAAAKGGPPGYVMVRFDDSLQDQWTNALPELQKYNLSASFLLITGALQNRSVSGLSYPYEEMSWQEAEQLYASGYYIVDHSQTHPDLDHESASGLWYQIFNSKEMLANHGMTNVSDFAPPYGSGFENATIIQYALQSGFCQVYSAYGIPGMSNYTRVKTQWFGISALANDTSLSGFESIVNQSSDSFAVGLEFHHVNDHVPGTEYYINTTDFEQDIQWLASSGFSVVLPYELPGYRQSCAAEVVTTYYRGRLQHQQHKIFQYYDLHDDDNFPLHYSFIAQLSDDSDVDNLREFGVSGFNDVGNNND
jgi:hypothetical protein